MTFATNSITTNIGPLAAAIGGLGFASAALVDATKALPNGGVSSMGFKHIEACMTVFLPGLERHDKTSLTAAILPTLHANWINGMALADQRDIARTLIKMKLTPKNARAMATVTEVNADDLVSALEEQQKPLPELTDAHKEALGRFDLALGSILDATYQEASQRYRNISKLWAGIVAIVLSVLGGAVVTDGQLHGAALGASLFCGLLAVPLAPMTKDIASALSAAAGAVQAARKVL